MKFGKPLFVLVVALVATLTIGYSSNTRPYHEQLIRIQTEQELGHLDSRIVNEPLEIQALLLDYAGDQALLLKAWIALAKYPAQSREVFRLYGSEPEFKAILQAYGEPVIPVIKYFLVNEVLSIKVMDGARNTIAVAKEAANNTWNRLSGRVPTNSSPVVQKPKTDLGPRERGWYAVNFIRQDGHDFLGQFVVNKDGEAKWLQTARGVGAITSFFSSGVRNLETKYVLSEQITIKDGLFAVLDVLPLVVTLKLLKAGKVAAAGGREISLASRTKVFASRLIPRGPLFQKLGKYGAAAATAYVVVTHPSLINSVLAEVAAVIGVNPLLFQCVVWFLFISVALYPFLWLLKAAARFILFSLSLIEWSRKKRVLTSPPKLPVMVAA